MPDVFISYARSDDEPPATAEFGWVTTFVGELKKVLRRKLGGKGAEVWMDHQLASNEPLTETLLERVRSSRTIVLFLSKGYLASRWCQFELERFLEQNAANKNRESVFVVAIDEADRTKLPQRIQELIPLELFALTLQGIPELLGYPFPPRDGDSNYWKRLNELAHWLAQQLSRQPSSAPLLEPVSSPSTAVKMPVVWIAQPSDDAFQGNWEGLASAIRQRGIAVLPTACSSYPVTSSDDFRARVESDLQKAAILVQYLSAKPGRVFQNGAGTPDSLQASLARLQCELRSGLTFIQRRARGINVEEIPDQAHRAFLRGVLECGPEELRSEVLAALDKLRQPVTPHPAPDGGIADSLSICITAGPKDQRLCDTVAEIIQQLGHTPLPAPPAPTVDQKPEEYRADFEALLHEVNGVIICHGSQPVFWVQGRYAQVLRVLAPRHRQRSGAILEGPPPEKVWSPRNNDGMARLDCRTGVTQEPIRKFVELLRQEATYA
ncbi:MAG TPA: toll/interleukin-1 receptor domain-containing protein [Verrucomicrobiota bacterium]|nr:hypothetical protein [Verrucomicrobiales bacterium]HRI13266.1 toll/interleukin-1 receptor domain-containing protein [Verrucomicrobiota bacterium]